ncbi:E3 ubiquitin-protein ligase TRIM65-like [Garra rufa]|uniref:E3 ubiquitin-protein ligase TRIM65-like n=1 Tax=Garra rufa TaxID=137080 RepID=UPI003CCEA7A5
MAQARFSKDQFSCPLCLDLLKDPVTGPCGHNYCNSCITDHWNREDQSTMRIYSCPKCRQTFSPRPALGKNTMLLKLVAEVVEQLKKIELQTAVPSEHEEGSRHNLMDATGQLQKKCHKHGKPLKIYCRSDQLCICVFCVLEEHNNHDIISTAAGRTEKQILLDETQRKYQQQILERERKLQELKESVETHKMIRNREKAVVSRTEELMERLEQEIDTLRRRNAELELLSLTDDDTHFLWELRSLYDPPESVDLFNIIISSYDDVRESISQLRQKLENFCRKEIEKISRNSTGDSRKRRIQTVANSEFESRKELLKYFCHFSVDLNTVHKHLQLSKKNRMIANTNVDQRYPNHPGRFDYWWQVLCSESICGRCYWEVQWDGTHDVGIAVSYESIRRKGQGDECKFGYNAESWSLDRTMSGYLFCHNNKQTKLLIEPSCSKIGVYVDQSAGILSFYSVSDTITLLHRVQTTFTQPLYPGIRIGFPIICLAYFLSSTSVKLLNK